MGPRLARLNVSRCIAVRRSGVRTGRELFLQTIKISAVSFPLATSSDKSSTWSNNVLAVSPCFGPGNTSLFYPTIGFLFSSVLQKTASSAKKKKRVKVYRFYASLSIYLPLRPKTFYSPSSRRYSPTAHPLLTRVPSHYSLVLTHCSVYSSGNSSTTSLYG
jgi:hypothetical protein